jgi:hypothetical protein
VALRPLRLVAHAAPRDAFQVVSREEEQAPEAPSRSALCAESSPPVGGGEARASKGAICGEVRASGQVSVDSGARRKA